MAGISHESLKIREICSSHCESRNIGQIYCKYFKFSGIVYHDQQSARENVIDEYRKLLILLLLSLSLLLLILLLLSLIHIKLSQILLQLEVKQTQCLQYIFFKNIVYSS